MADWVLKASLQYPLKVLCIFYFKIGQYFFILMYPERISLSRVNTNTQVIYSQQICEGNREFNDKVSKV